MVPYLSKLLLQIQNNFHDHEDCISTCMIVNDDFKNKIRYFQAGCCKEQVHDDYLLVNCKIFSEL